MRKLLAAVLAATLMLCSAVAEEIAFLRVEFPQGFSLELPADWVQYPVAEEDAQAGVLHLLGDASGEKVLYIEAIQAQYADVQALLQAAQAAPGLENTGIYAFGGVEFVIVDLPEENLSGCLTLLHGQTMAFLFHPLADSDFMMEAAKIMESYVEISQAEE